MIWIGDVHGCSKTLLALIKLLPKNREIGFLGDLVDRGPNSVEAVKIALDHSDDILCGNHDMMMVKCLLTDKNNGYFWDTWRHNGNAWVYRDFNFGKPGTSEEEALALISTLYERLIMFKVTDHAIATHAFADKTVWCKGYQPPLSADEAFMMKLSGIDVEKPDNDQLKMPTAAEAIQHILSPDLKSSVFEAFMPEDQACELLWGRRLKESDELARITGKKLIHGHSIPRDKEVHISDNFVLVDTGCFMGSDHYLSAYDDETGEVWRQVNIDAAV